MLTPLSGQLAPLTRPRGKKSYLQRILNTQSANLLACWDLSETSGTNAANKQGTSARDGTYVNGVTLNAVTFLDGTPAPSFDGTDDYVNIYSASLQSAFGGQELTWMAWAKIPNWSQGSTRSLLRVGGGGAFTDLLLLTSGNLRFRYNPDGVSTRTLDINPGAPSGWFPLAITASYVGNFIKMYFGGSQVGTGAGGFGQWTALLGSGGCVIGANSSAPALSINAFIKYVMLWSTPLSLAEIAALATV